MPSKLTIAITTVVALAAVAQGAIIMSGSLDCRDHPQQERRVGGIPCERVP